MLKHYIDIATNTYIIERDEVVVFSINLDDVPERNHIIIKTPKEVYAGPIELIGFKEDTWQK